MSVEQDSLLVGHCSKQYWGTKSLNHFSRSVKKEETANLGGISEVERSFLRYSLDVFTQESFVLSTANRSLTDYFEAAAESLKQKGKPALKEHKISFELAIKVSYRATLSPKKKRSHTRPHSYVYKGKQTISRRTISPNKVS